MTTGTITPLERALADREELTVAMDENPRFAQYYVQEVRHSYKLLYEMAALRDGKMRRTPGKSRNLRDWPRDINVLEIGYGDGWGIEHLFHPKMNVVKRNVYGVEIIPELHERAKDRFPGSQFALIPDGGGKLQDVLNAWGDGGVRFNIVVARMVLDRIDEPVKVMNGIRRVLLPTKPGGQIMGVFGMTVSRQQSTERRDHWRDNWKRNLTIAKLNPYEMGFWKHRTILGGEELYSFSTVKE
jgi:SAM-dependent methyltransferase